MGALTHDKRKRGGRKCEEREREREKKAKKMIALQLRIASEKARWEAVSTVTSSVGIYLLVIYIYI
jgi:hypothetical protein